MANSTETRPNLVTAIGWADDEITEQRERLMAVLSHFASDAQVGGMLDLDDIAAHLENVSPFAIDVSVVGKRRLMAAASAG